MPTFKFGFSLRIDNAGTRRAQKADVVRQIEGWLSTIDYNEDPPAVNLSQPPSRAFRFADWRVTLTALPISQVHRGNGPKLLMGPGVSYWGDTTITSLRKQISKKSSQCRDVRHSLIVAVLNRKAYARPKLVDQALFGSVSLRYSLDDHLDHAQFAAFVRNADGIWHPGPPTRGARVSAVLFSENLSPAHVAAHLPSLWINPWATTPVPNGLPFEKRTATDSGQVLLQSEATVEAHEVLRLPAGWPGPVMDIQVMHGLPPRMTGRTSHDITAGG